MFSKVLFSRLCLVCGKKIGEKSSFTCEKCTNIIQYEVNEVRQKNINNMHFDELYSAFLYSGFIRNKILQFKFHNRPYLGKVFADVLVRMFYKYSVNVDVIIPVPIHYKRYFERGYNQSKIVAKCMASKINISMQANVLKKIVNSNKQSILNAPERKKNVLNSFKVTNKKHIQGKRVLLIDDIYTTGATANECSKVLKQSGAVSVIVMTIAYGKLK